LLSSNISSRCPHNMVKFGLLAAEIVSSVWGTPANFNGFRVLAELLHGTLVWASAKLRRSKEGVTYIRQGGHQAGHWPTFLVWSNFWATVCKTVRPMRSDRCLSVCLPVLSVCDVRALWPNGWTDQDETNWPAGRPRPHCVR